MFGIDEKKKRGLIVPAMAIMVCAIAMVGLGYAITISSHVTSQNNTTAVLMVDMAPVSAYSDFKDVDKPRDTSDINGLLGITISNNRVEGSGGIQSSGGYALFKVFGTLDKTAFTLKVELSSNANVGLSLYAIDKVNGKVDFSSSVADMADDGTFKKNDDAAVIECEKLYLVAVSSIGGNVISYGTGSVAISDTAEYHGTITDSGTTTSAYQITYKFTAESIF